MSGLITRTFNTSGRLNGSTPGRLGGLFFSVVSIFPSCTIRAPKTPSLMLWSRVFDRSDQQTTPEFILSERLVVSTITWETESKVRTALQGVTPLFGCPPGRLFVPEGLRSDVIHWGHCSKVACHPGIN